MAHDGGYHRDGHSNVPKVPLDGNHPSEIMIPRQFGIEGHFKPRATLWRLRAVFSIPGESGGASTPRPQQIADRAKEHPLVSGAKNKFFIEGRACLMGHRMLEPCCCAQPMIKWGKVPCAFIELNPVQRRRKLHNDRLCPARTLARVQNRPNGLSSGAPKTSTRKGTKIRYCAPSCEFIR